LYDSLKQSYDNTITTTEYQTTTTSTTTTIEDGTELCVLAHFFKSLIYFLFFLFFKLQGLSGFILFYMSNVFKVQNILMHTAQSNYNQLVDIIVGNKI